jgi:hypothetical protein
LRQGFAQELFLVEGRDDDGNLHRTKVAAYVKWLNRGAKGSVFGHPASDYSCPNFRLHSVSPRQGALK